MSDPIGETIVGRDELRAKVAELGAQISADYEGKDLVLVGVLKGAVFFLADLARSRGSRPPSARRAGSRRSSGWVRRAGSCSV